MFDQNKYYNWYKKIITAAQTRTLDKAIYTERHHIIPKCLGGSNAKSNLATLTAREHFVAHLLLVKCVQGQRNKFKMMSAVSKFTCSRSYQQRILSSRQYQLCREYAQESARYFAKLRGPRSQETIEKTKKTCLVRYGSTNTRLGARLSEDQKNRLSEIRATRPTYETWFKNANVAEKKDKHQEWAKKNSSFVTNNPSLTEEGKRKLSESKSEYYYITPWGEFSCRYDFDQHPICRLIGFDTIYRLYGGLNATIKTRAINRAKLSSSWLNKTWSEVGFDKVKK